MTTYYIDPAGNDTTGDGSTGNPWQSLGKANTSAANGDTIIMKDGTYGGALWSAILTLAPLTIQAENTGLAILDGESANDTVYYIQSNGPAAVTYKGLKFIDCGNVTTGARIFVAIGAYPNNWINCTFLDCYPKASGWAAGLFHTQASPALANFYGCLFDNIIAPTKNANGLITGTETKCVLKMHNCTVYTDGAPIIMWNSGNEGHTVDIKNTIFYSIQTATQWSGQWAGYPKALGIFNNNCYYNYVTDEMPDGNNNLGVDPQFKNAAGHDFELELTSPCLPPAGVPI